MNLIETIKTKVKRFFGVRKPNTYYLVAWYSRYAEPGVAVETAISGFPFISKEEAMEFAERNKNKMVALEFAGILEVEANIPMTYAKYDAVITPHHPHTTVEFFWPEGAEGKLIQDAAEARYKFDTQPKIL